MLKQANLYLNESDKKTYLAAAARFRLPYWDIIMPRNEQAVPPSGQQPDPKTIWGCPDIFKKAKVFVKLPKPDPQTVKNGFSEIDNPLGSFNYPTTKEYSANPDRKVLKLGSGYVYCDQLIASLAYFQQCQSSSHDSSTYTEKQERD